MTYVFENILVLATAILGTALMWSDIEHRGEAVVDPLTGLLNRKALDYRKLERYARGEIDREEYLQRRKDLVG